jgi:predicted DNA-binding transcriptional regulator AlpA
MAAINTQLSTNIQAEPERIVSTSEITQRSGLSKSTLCRLERKGLFPKRQAIGLRKKGLPESVFAAWLATRAPADTQ